MFLANLLVSEATDITKTAVATFFLGMAIIFLGIAVLVLVVWTVGKLQMGGKEKKVKVQPAEQSAPAPALVAVEEGVPEHIKVAITAAVYAMLADETNNGRQFVVRKIIKRR